jgi:hypothetical protein
MTDEPREENQPEEEVEAHSPPVGLPPLNDPPLNRNDEDDDVEAHSQHGKAHGKQHAG